MTARIRCMSCNAESFYSDTTTIHCATCFRKLKDRIADLEIELLITEEVAKYAVKRIGLLEKNALEFQAKMKRREEALLQYADAANWSIRSMLPPDYADTDEWIGPSIPGYAIARAELEDEK